jgi:hypothetical protein
LDAATKNLVNEKEETPPSNSKVEHDSGSQNIKSYEVSSPQDEMETVALQEVHHQTSKPYLVFPN